MLRRASKLSLVPAIPSFLDPVETPGELTHRQRKEILALATEVSYRPRAIVYREHAPEAFVFICVSGIFKSYRDLPSGRRRVLTFRFPGDLFGLAEKGRYVNSVQACTPAVAYRIPVEQARAKLRQDAELQFRVLAKVTHEVREAQRRAIMLGSKSAQVRLAMFLNMLRADLAIDSDRIPLAMSRADIASFLALTPEAVSRGTALLVKAGIIAFPTPRVVRILLPSKIDELTADL